MPTDNVNLALLRLMSLSKDKYHNAKPQPQIHLEVLRCVCSWQSGNLDIATGQLVVNAFLYMMRFVQILGFEEWTE